MCLTNIQVGVISRVTVLRAGLSEVRILAPEKTFSLLKNVQTGFRGIQPPSQRVQGSFVGREGGGDVQHLPPPIPEVKKELSYISVSPIRLHSVVRVYLSLTFQRSADNLIDLFHGVGYSV